MGFDIISISEPAIVYPKTTISPIEFEILPEGIGRFFVRGIKASVFLSCQWFNAPEPQDMRKTPTNNNNPCLSILPEYKT